MKLTRHSFADVDFIAGCASIAYALSVVGFDWVRLAGLIDPRVAVAFALAAFARWILTVKGSQNG